MGHEVHVYFTSDFLLELLPKWNFLEVDFKQFVRVLD